MEIRKWRPANRAPTPNGFRHVADFNLAISDDLTLFDLSIIRAPDGSLKVYPPQHGGVHVAAISPALRTRIIALASAQIDCENHDRAA